MKLKTKLLGLFGGVFIAIVSIDLYIAHVYKQAMLELRDIHELAEHRVILTLTTQVNFKKQVQEWNNVLLRGLTPELYKLHYKKFIEEEAKTRNVAIKLKGMLSSNHEAYRLIEKFLNSHSRMGLRYREALTAFFVAEHDPHITVDKYVRGIDKEPTETLRLLVSFVKKQELKEFNAITRKNKDIETTIFFSIIIGFFVLGLILYFSVKYTLLIPIQKLMEATIQISHGNLQYRTDITGNNEFSLLGRQFNIMAADIELAELSIKQRNAHISGIFNTVNEGIITMSACGRIENVNPAVEKIFGFSKKQIKSVSFTDLLSEEDKNKYQYYISQYSQGSHVDVLGDGPRELMGLHKNGSAFAIEVSVNKMETMGEKLFVAVIRDISKSKLQEQRLQQITNFDILTGLPNRNLFKDRLQQAMQLAVRQEWLLPVILIDLDMFKRINDTMGHGAGDELLKQVASRLQTSIRPCDTVARMGGDEFTILIDGVKYIDQVNIAVEKIIESIKQPFYIKTQEVFITASIGITIFPFGSNDADEIIKAADIAMYKAKELGRNGYQFYTIDMDRFAMDKLDMESRLRQALRNDEFILHYQPQIAIQSGQIMGVEALLRWEQPGVGLVPPMQFLPLLEETGLIIPVGEKILEMAFEQLSNWQDEGFNNIKISVNLSARQFDDNQLVDKIRELLNSSYIDSHLIELEITETAIMQDAAISREKLKILSEMGFTIAIDDFGTGHSSLAYLKEFPVDTLKIDRSFVKDLEHQEGDRAITSAIVSLAQAINLSVVAEGVENKAQFEIIEEFGCDIVQGYYFSKPVEADEIFSMLNSQFTSAQVNSQTA